MEWKKERKVRKEDEGGKCRSRKCSETRSLGRRTATPIHEITTTTTTPTKKTRVKSLVLPFLDRPPPGCKSFQSRFCQRRRRTRPSPLPSFPLSLEERRVQNEILRFKKKKKEAHFCFRRSNLHNNCITMTNTHTYTTNTAIPELAREVTLAPQ